jgi:hypothetical protein
MDRIDLNYYMFIKGSMKFTPKVGKKDKAKKSKKGNKGSHPEHNKKIIKKSISTTKKPNNENQNTKNLNLDTKNVENNLNNNNNNNNENSKLIKSPENKSITVNTINSENNRSPKKDNGSVIISSIKESQIKTSSKKVILKENSITSPLNKNIINKEKSNEKVKQRSNENKNEKNSKKSVAISKPQNNLSKNIILEQKVSNKDNKLSELKMKQSVIEVEEDSISELSDDNIKTLEIKDSIEESSHEKGDEFNQHPQKKIIHSKKLQDNEDKTLVEDVDVLDGNNSDKIENEHSSEIADETLVIDDSERILETSDEEIIKKGNETSKKQVAGKENSKTKVSNNKRTRKNKTDVDENNNEDHNNDIEIIDKNKEKEISKSIYDLLDQEEFNQSIDTSEYDKPINSNDIEIEAIVQEISTPRKRVERTPKKTRGRKPVTPKKPIEIIVISDDEEEDINRNGGEGKNLSKDIVIKSEKEEDLPVEIKQEVDEIIEQRINKSPKKVVTRAIRKRLNKEMENNEIEEEQEQNQNQEPEGPIRKVKRSRTTKKLNNNKIQREEDENINVNVDEDETGEPIDQIQEQQEEEEEEEEVIRSHEKEKKTKKSKTMKSNKTYKSTHKNQKSSKTSKTTSMQVEHAIISETEDEQSEYNDMASDSTPKKKTSKKRKNTTSPSKKTSKKKKVHYQHEDGISSGNEEEHEHEPVDISSRTIADIIDNYRGTEISTTQKEIYRLAALKRKATLDRKRGRITTPEITTKILTQKSVDDTQEKKPKVYDPKKNKTAIQMRVVNGEIVIDQQSTMIDHIDTTDEALPMLKYDDNNHITSASFKPKLKPLKWTKDETELFYQCLSIFGTNFSMLAIMFPTRNRKQLLNKYKNEEKVNPGHVKYALKHKKALDPDFFYKYSGQDMMEIGREAVEEVRLIEEQRKRDDMEFLKKKESNDIKKVVIKNENVYNRTDVKDVKPILAN